MATGGLAGTGELVLSKLLKDAEWPFFRLRAVASLLMTLGLGAALFIAGVETPTRVQMKYVLSSSMFGTLGFVLSIFGVQLGASPGDVSALSSTNVLFASFMGYAILGEPIHWVHGVALVCAIGGSFLICRPAFMFGGDPQAITAVYGQALAPISGLANAMAFICVRLSGKTSAWYPPLCTSALSFLVCMVLPVVFPRIESLSAELLTRNPLQTAGIVTVTCSITFSAMSLKYIGPRFCPAAISTTVFCASKLVFGYLAQVLLFDMAPDLIIITGAVFLLASVVIMTLSRKSKPNTPGPGVVDSLPTEMDVRGAPADAGDIVCADARQVAEDDETESVASFAAAEFIEFAPHESIQMPRQRRVVQMPAALSIGAVLA